jgi:putative transposase
MASSILPKESKQDNSILGDSSDALQALMKSALEGFMSHELDAIIGAARYQREEQRKDIRNGYRSRRFDTRMGSIDLAIPRARDTTYMPTFLEHRERSEKALVALIQEAYISGVSTRKIEKLVETLGVSSLSKSQVSEYCKEIEELITAFRHRPLTQNYPYVFFDALYEKVRVDGLVQSQAVVVAYGIAEDGKREPIGLDVVDTESYTSWSGFFRELLERGLKGVRLVISDAHAGLTKAIGEIFLGTVWQRCKVHFMRNVLAPVPKSKKDAFAADLKQIYHQNTLEDAQAVVEKIAEKYGATCSRAVDILLDGIDDTLRYLAFPDVHWSKISSTNPIERLNREIRRRTKVVGVFPSVASALRLIGAVLLEQTEDWATQGYMCADSMKQLPLPK